MAIVAIGLAALLVAADQLIKYFVAAFLKPVGAVSVVDNLIDLIYYENHGMSFGMMEGARWIFVIFTAVAMVVMIYLLFRNKNEKKMYYISIALIIGGGVGNMIDRILYGYVIDYFRVSFFPPICNFADYCIVIGAVLLAVYILFFSSFFKTEKTKNAEKIGSLDEEAEVSKEDKDGSSLGK